MPTQISPFWRGHLFLFDAPKPTTYDSAVGNRLLLIFLLLEVIVRPLLLFASRSLDLTHQTSWLLIHVGLLLITTFLMIRTFTPLLPVQFGLYAWRNWTMTERLYFLQVIPLATIVFSYFSFGKLEVLWTRPNLVEICVTNFLPEVMWGLYQELLYRGLLQTELVRRWGPLKGIAISNLIFTFGPLHAYHFLAAQGNPSHLWMFAAIFCIGLLFAILFRRSGNLWIVGIMHGLGDMFLVGLTKI